MKKNKNSSEDRYLHNLLQLKKLERPDEQTWAQFEYSLERKCLGSIVGKDTSWTKKIFNILFNKNLAYALASICLTITCGILIQQITKCDNQYYDKIVDISTVENQKSYVYDAIMTSTPITISADLGVRCNRREKGIGYVCDVISNSNLSTQ